MPVPSSLRPANAAPTNYCKVLPQSLDAPHSPKLSTQRSILIFSLLEAWRGSWSCSWDSPASWAPPQVCYQLFDSKTGVAYVVYEYNTDVPRAFLCSVRWTDLVHRHPSCALCGINCQQLHRIPSMRERQRSRRKAAEEANRPKATCRSLLLHARAMCAHARLPNDGLRAIEAMRAGS